LYLSGIVPNFPSITNEKNLATKDTKVHEGESLAP
jgi:hypothetical protein